MNRSIVITITLVMWLSSLFTAAQSSLQVYLKERDGLLGKYLSGQLPLEKTFERSRTIHAFFKENNQQALAQEENLYTGYLLFYSGDYQKSIEALKSGVVKIRPKNDTLLFKYTCLIADIYRDNQAFTESEEYFQRGYEQINASIESAIPNEVIIFYNNYSLLLHQTGDIELEKVILEKALVMASKEKNDYQSPIEAKLAEYYNEQSDFGQTESYLKAAISHTVKPFDRLPRLLQLATLYAQQNRWLEFSKTLAAAKRDYAQIKNVSDEFIQYGVQLKLLESEYLVFQNNKPQAIINTNEAVALALSYGPQNRFLGEAYIQSGDLSGELPAKITAYNAAIAAVSKAGEVLYPREYLEAMRKRAAIEPPKHALATYQQAIVFSAKNRKSFTSENSKYFYEESLRPLFGSALAAAATSPGETFTLIEQSKAAVLNEVLQDRRIKFGNVDAVLLKEEKALQQEITKLKTVASKENGTEEKLRELQIKQEFLTKKIEKESPDYYTLKYQNTAYSAKEIQQKLDDNTAVLSYFKADSTLYISVITNSSIVGKKVKLSADYKQCMDYFREVLYSNPGLGKYTGSKAAQCMYGYLIKPVENELIGKKRLLIIRDAELNLLPFEVLEFQPEKYLLNRFVISYNYAASLLFSEAENKQRNFKTLSFAPYAEQSILKNQLRDRSLGPLPFSNKEVTEIGGNIYRDKAATKRQFMENYRKNGIIHFATHAQIDDQNPSKSFIAFYPDSIDYKLYTSELYNLSLENTQLVVLSACEAGRGKIQGGEGMLSLARGFAYAGCPAVITTLWNAHDESSAYLAERLHHYLQKGLMKDEALQQAKIDFMNADIGRQLNHPYYWANFILIGDASAASSPTNWWVWIGVLAVVLIVLCIIVWRRTSKSPPLRGESTLGGFPD